MQSTFAKFMQRDHAEWVESVLRAELARGTPKEALEVRQHHGGNFKTTIAVYGEDKYIYEARREGAPQWQGS